MATTSPSGRRLPTLRRVLKWLGVLCVGLAALAVALVAWLQAPAGRRLVLSRVTQLLAAQEIDFRADQLRYNLLDLSLDLRNVTIRSTRKAQDPPFAVIAHLSADLSLVDLIRGRYVVEAADIDGLSLQYLIDADGDNLPRPPSDPNEPSKPLDYLIARMSVTHAQVRYDNRVQQISATVPLSLMSVKGDRLTDRHAVSLSSRDGQLHATGRDVRLDSLSADLDLGKDDVRVAHATMDAEGTHLEVSGTLERFDDPRLDARMLAVIDVARAARLAGPMDPAAGRVTVDARASGPVAAPELDARIEGRALGFRTLDRTSLDAHVGYDTARRQATAHALDVHGPWGRLTGEGGLSMAEAPSRVSVRATKVDLQSLMRALEFSRVAAARLDVRAEARWSGMNYSSAIGEARAFLTPTAAKASRSTLPMSGRLVVKADGRRIVAQLSQIQGAGARLDGRVSLVDGTRIGGDLRADVADVKSTAATLEAFVGRPSRTLMSTRISGEVGASARLGGTLARPVADASIKAPALAVANAGTLALDGRLRYTPAVVSVDAVDVVWGEGTARVAGSVGLSNRQPLDLRFEANRLQVPSLLALAGQDPGAAQGTMSLSGHAAGTSANPSVEASLRGADLVVSNERLGAVSADVALTGRQVTLPRLVLDKPQPGGNGRLSASGRYHMGTGAYTFDVDSFNLQLLGLLLPDGRQVTAAVALAGKGTGSTRSPAGDLTLTLERLRLAEHDLGRVNLDAAVANKRADVELSAARFGLTAHASADLVESYPGRVDARVANLDLAALPLTLQTPLEGSVNATATASGSLTNLKRASGKLDVQTFEGRWNRQPFAIDGPAVLALVDERLTIDRLTVTAQDSTLSVTGMLPLDTRTGQGALQLDARANLATLARYAPADAGLTADGALQLTGTVRGNLEFLDPDLQLSIDNVELATPQQGTGVNGLTARARVAAGVATIERLTANWSAAVIEAAGEVPLDLLPALPVEIPRRGGPARVRGSVVGLDPATIPGAPDGLSGRISMSLDASAGGPDLAALTGTVTFPELRVTFRDLDLAQRQPSSIRIGDGAATIDQFALSGSAGTLQAQGTVGLLDRRPLNVTVDGDFNTAAASSLTDVVRTEGKATVHVSATGTMDAPALSGVVALSDVMVAVDEPEIVAEGLNARVELAGERITLSSLTAGLNGGTLTGSGSLAIRDGAFRDVRLKLDATDVAFDAPLDLRSLSDTTLTLTELDGNLLVNGKVLIREGGLTGDIDFDTGLLARLTAPRALDLTDERNPLLDRVRFNLQVQTAAPILVDNNLARAEVRTNLRLLGTPYETGLSGTLTVLEGGEITLNEHRYEVERGTITFLEERRIVPSFDLRLNTTAGNYDVVLAVNGEPGDTETSLTSDPSLPEPDIMALLVTGRTLDEMRGEEGEIAKEQVLSYVAGRVGSRLGRGLEKATGLSEVRLEPNLIANEADPSARLTVAQDLTDELKFVYSTDLADSNDQIWVARYDVTRRFQTNVVRQSDSSYRMDFRHDVRFGGLASPRRTPSTRPTVASVQVTGDDVLGEAEVRKHIGFEPGDSFDYFKARDRVADIQDALQERGRLQARVRLDRPQEGNTVALRLGVTSGPVVELSYAGVQPPSKVDKEVRRQWNRGVFDSQRTGDATEVLREWLIDQRHLTPEITHRVEDVSPKHRRVVFTIAPGPRFERIEMQFAGAEGIQPSTLDAVVDQQDLERELFTDPLVVTELLRRYYREEGYLTAEIEAPRYEYEGNVARAVVQVHEGPRFTIRRVSVSGNHVLKTPALLGELPLAVGDPFLPRAAEHALERTRELYWRHAYNDVRPEYSLTLDRRSGQVDVALAVEEGPQSVIADLRVEGNLKTSDRLVREQLEIETAQPLDLSALGRSRRNLYDTGAFSMVDITREPVAASTNGNPVAAQTDGGTAQTNGETKPVRVNVQLREVQPFQLRYGASYDTERGLGGILDVSNHNTLGKARVLGLSGRYDARLREGRVYLSQPSLKYWLVETTASLYYREERNAESALADPFNVDRFGVSIQQERKLSNAYVWSYGYRYERARKFAAVPGAVGEIIAVSPLTSTFTREARDEMLDATRGSFTSHGLSYSPSWLGGDSSYLKYYGQYFRYFPLQPERRKPFTNEVLRPRFVYATGARLGLAAGWGGRVPETERFYAGGSTTLRGFEQNAVGPVGADRIPTGGEALLVLNNEVRFPLISVVDGVGFLDIGNVFDRVSDFSFSDLRETAGVGVRVRTPWFLIRGDYGVVLDQRPGERRSRFYFSIGQAF